MLKNTQTPMTASEIEREMQSRTVFKLHSFLRGFEDKYGKLMEEATGLNLYNFRVVYVLGLAKELSPKELGSVIAPITMPALSRTLKSLINLGLLECRQDAVDRRSTIYSLTEKGQKTFEAGEKVILARQQAFTSALDQDEIQLLRSIIEKLHKAIL